MAKMDRVSVNAYAKVNFTLDVVGRAGGYHLLDSLVCTVSLFDRVTARRRTDGRCRVVMTGADAPRAEESNALRAARAFCERFRAPGADLFIERAIPAGAGLGSSSADAAGVLAALSRLYPGAHPEAVGEIADALGSDTRYLLTGGWARMTGRGEKIAPLDGLPQLYLTLFLPARGVSTPACFAEYDRRGERFPPLTQAAIGGLRRGDALFGNALTEAACALCPETAAALEEAARLSPMHGMTGSGSACYAAFASDAARAAKRGENCRTVHVCTIPSLR